VRSQSSASGDLLAGYRRGEHEAVWTELRAHRAIDGDCRAKALVVATETMTRVGRCADLIAERLAANEWVALTGRLHWPPSERDQQIINDIEQLTAALLPPSLVRSGTSSGTTTKRSRRPASAWVAPCSSWTPACLSSSAHDSRNGKSVGPRSIRISTIPGISTSRRTICTRPISAAAAVQHRTSLPRDRSCLHQRKARIALRRLSSSCGPLGRLPAAQAARGQDRGPRLRGRKW
jgi:hypothetical protein